MPDFVGTNATETLNGTSVSDTIQGLGGSDQIDGLDGVDTISGGDGSDTIRGGNGNDTIYGHSAADLDSNSGDIVATLLADVGDGAVFVTGAPGDDGFVYAVRKDVGDIVRIDTSTGAQSLFLDIPASQFSDGGERGVLGLAFHPDHAANGRFFVLFTQPSGDIEIREYARSAGDPTLADPTPTGTIITIPHSTFATHNGGSLAFGPDNYLYVSVGDGGGPNDPAGNAQNLDVLLGKILRIDVDGDDFPADASRNYAIPPDNPFAGATPGLDEIWAWGLRNPWRTSFDSLTGDFYFGDVGQGLREEVDFESAGGPGGANYGWDYREGTVAGPSPPPDPPIIFTDPVFDYARDIGASITGGYVYHGPAAGLQGVYVFADFISGRLLTLRMVDGVAEDSIEHTAQVVGADLGLISSFGTDNEANLYVVTLAGAIYRLDPGIAAGDGADTIDGGAGDDLLFGGQGNDTLIGGPDADALDGGAGSDLASYAGAGTGLVARLDAPGLNTEDAAGDSYASIENLTGSSFGDTLVGNAMNNVLNGDGGNDSLSGGGGGGNDRLDGGAGADTLVGGAGDDVYVVDQAGDIVTENSGEGTDEVRTALAVAGVSNYANVENLTYTGVASFTGTGNAGDNVITGGVAGDSLSGQNGNDRLVGLGGNDTLDGGIGNDVLDGGGGIDNMTGGGGNDTYVVNVIADIVTEGAGGGTDTVETVLAYTLGANVENLTLTGGSPVSGTGNGLVNVLTGNAAGNMLDGGAGADTMNGGPGNDTYVVDTSADIAFEVAGGGNDLVQSSVTYTLGDSVERLTLTGAGAINGTGNGQANILVGNAAANILNGGLGLDAMTGGNGDDTYVVDNVGDSVTEIAGEGIDTVSSGISYMLGSNVERLVLTGSAANGTGNALANTLIGNGNANTLNGGGGVDSLRGGDGNDTYQVDEAGDVVIETNALAAGGVDTVRSTITFILGGNVENLILLGAAAINGTGNALANTITGNGAPNTLNGGAGADSMRGGDGDDLYLVDDAGDLVIETNAAAAGGVDKVQSSISFILGGNIENLTLIGSAANGTGNALNNIINGNTQANVLNGGAGADTMSGGLGNDTYQVDNIGDQAIETTAGGGSDTVLTSVTFTLGLHVDNLTMTGAAAINGTGNATANIFNGNGADNILDGAGGNDVINAGNGNDTLIGGAGSDTLNGSTGNDDLYGGIGIDTMSGSSGSDDFFFDTALNAVTNVDAITDYSAAADTIFLDDAIFTGIAAGALAVGAFRAGSAALDADDRILYDSVTGHILYDSDGIGGAAAILFATVTPATTVTAADFTVF